MTMFITQALREHRDQFRIPTLTEKNLASVFTDAYKGEHSTCIQLECSLKAFGITERDGLGETFETHNLVAGDIVNLTGIKTGRGKYSNLFILTGEVDGKSVEIPERINTKLLTSQSYRLTEQITGVLRSVMSADKFSLIDKPAQPIHSLPEFGSFS